MNCEAKPIDTVESPEFAIAKNVDRVSVRTGDHEFIVEGQGFSVQQHTPGSPSSLRPAFECQFAVTDAKSRRLEFEIDDVCVTAHGPVLATIELCGTIRRLGADWRAQLAFWSGTGLVRVRHTICNPNRARHRDGLWDLGDRGSLYFRDLSLVVAAHNRSAATVVWKLAPDDSIHTQSDAKVEIYQDSSGGENWNNKNHMNRLRRVPCRFRGFKVQATGCCASGDRAAPMISLESADASATVAVPEFWQQFPKSLDADSGVLHARLFPQQWDDVFELQGGEQKTHTIWLAFADAGSDAIDALDWVHDPIRIRPLPHWCEQSEAIEFLTVPAADADSRLADLLNGPPAASSSLHGRREAIDEYGWRNYGDVFADHEQTYYKGPRPAVSHYNNQFDMVYGFILQWLRTGDANWFGLLDPLARHVIDIDIYHTTKDRAVYNGGLFWFTDHYKSAETSTHRTFSRANGSPGQPYGGGPGAEHNFSTGLLHYYYLTGDVAARDAVIGLANWVISMDDGSRNILGLVDDGPTGKACCSDRGPGRGAGNSISVLLDAWTLTRNGAFLSKAEDIIRRTVHPNDDVESKHLLDVEKHWSYTVCLTSLDKFLRTKREAGQIDFAYAYARASLLRYAEWMASHERPYFDQADQLEFPTEAWAAQELRKANVLRLAASYAESGLRARLWKRGMELADRAWSDLQRFESRTATRALAVVMVEGTKDYYFRTIGLNPDETPPGQFEFGTPIAFIPQKQRVLSDIKTARGLGRAVWRMLQPAVWKRCLSSAEQHDPAIGAGVGNRT